MKKIIIYVLIVLLSSIAISGAGSQSGVRADHQAMKGYLTLGSTVVALPVQLQPGDRILFIKPDGRTVLRQTVSGGFFSITAAKLSTGVYIVSVMRNGRTIAETAVPVKVS